MKQPPINPEAENAVKHLITYIGDDPNREGLEDTPRRVVKSFAELYGGYIKDPAEVLSTVFTSDADEMVMCNDIEFFSTCEHHMLPFFGKVHIAYLPNGKVIGLSKLARLVEVFARRLQIQEQLTTQIAEALQTHLSPLGVAVVVEAEHFCMKARGVKNPSSYMKTSKLLGEFRRPEVRAEFFSMIPDWRK